MSQPGGGGGRRGRGRGRGRGSHEEEGAHKRPREGEGEGEGGGGHLVTMMGTKQGEPVVLPAAYVQRLPVMQPNSVLRSASTTSRLQLKTRAVADDDDDDDDDDDANDDAHEDDLDSQVHAALPLPSLPPSLLPSSLAPSLAQVERGPAADEQGQQRIHCRHVPAGYYLCPRGDSSPQANMGDEELELLEEQARQDEAALLEKKTAIAKAHA